MARPPVERSWKGEDVAVKLTADPTPYAGIDLLAGAEAYPIDAATTPYCGCARSFDGCTNATPGERHIGLMVAPGGRRARAAITRACILGATGGTPTPAGASFYDNWSWTVSGGTTGNDIVVTKANGDMAGLDFTNIYDRAYHFGIGNPQEIVMTGDTDDPAPTKKLDRLYELAEHASPYIEPIYISGVAGYSVAVVKRTADLEVL